MKDTFTVLVPFEVATKMVSSNQVKIRNTIPLMCIECKFFCPIDDALEAQKEGGAIMLFQSHQKPLSTTSTTVNQRQ